ncbi:MAG: hypothetical protein WD801_12305 [Gemmatimonadaceae bacterium]
MTTVFEHGRARLFAALIAVALLSGCAAMRGASEDSGEPARVRVENRAYTDMTIYALEGGSVRRRLGVASSVSTSTFTIPASLVGLGREVQFLADPIGARGSQATRRIMVYPGDTVVLTIPPS